MKQMERVCAPIAMTRFTLQTSSWLSTRGTSSAASVNPKPRGKPRERSSGPRSPSAAHASKTLAVKNRGEGEVWRQREGTKAMRPTWSLEARSAAMMRRMGS